MPMAALLSHWSLHGRHQLLAASRRTLSSKSSTSSSRFTYAVPSKLKDRRDAIFATLKDSGVLDNPHGYNAAVVLVTPEYAKHLNDETFMATLAQELSGSTSKSDFHLLAAVVDHIAPPVGSYKPLTGFSALRGHVDDILPNLWHESPPRTKEDADAVAALTFELEQPAVTLPLTRTTFLNNRPSTLIANVFDLSGSAPRLVQSSEKHSQNVRIPSLKAARSIGDLGLHSPLAPVTLPRTIVGSFGNIVKAVEVDGQVTPASTELEEAVNSAYERSGNGSDAAAQQPKVLGIWCVVAPPASSGPEQGSSVKLALEDGVDIKEVAQSTAHSLRDLYKRGGRIYKILSGGGGWGAKKGLLSLDPQQRHFSLSEEEEMERFMRTMDDKSDFAPSGSTIQFFTAIEAPSGELDAQHVPGAVFGVPGAIDASVPSAEQDEAHVIAGLFGALSNNGIYISGPEVVDQRQGASPAETKLTVPHARIYATDDGAEANRV